MSVAEVRNLVKKYPSFVLDDVSFGVGRGRITGFIGRNGAGKTTTIKSMLNLIHPDSGEVLFFGKPFLRNESEIKQRIGYSTGTVNWYPRKRIRDILDIEKRFYETWDAEACRKYAELFQLDDTKTPRELSEGMKVKFNLMLALSHKAEVLILDEPTSGLDPFSRSELLDIFTELKAEGVAVFFSTHIISDIEKCADDIVYISKGRIVSASSKEDFIHTFSSEGETLEDTMLRLEKEASHA
ncbi:MAG: ABC transporter ATP-binding protein [Clostridia bacterium]|nr:ABC transporter ATP-binding protein [Lachnospiraceae bacterium]MBP5728735.1 ABC transporter ATP-binding protein [Clostridia bacterium]